MWLIDSLNDRETGLDGRFRIVRLFDFFVVNRMLIEYDVFFEEVVHSILGDLSGAFVHLRKGVINFECL